MARGSCLCNQIEFEYSGEPSTTALCHCVDCQKWTGAAYTANLAIHRGNFKVTKGQDVLKSYEAIGASGKIKRFWFCSNCGSSLYDELEMIPDVTFVKSGTLDGGASNHDIAVEYYTKDRLKYVAPVEGAEQKLEFS